MREKPPHASRFTFHVLRNRYFFLLEDHDEVYRAGDVYYMAPGHLPLIEEEIELVEFSPRGEYQRTMEVVARNFESVPGHA